MIRFTRKGSSIQSGLSCKIVAFHRSHADAVPAAAQLNFVKLVPEVNRSCYKELSMRRSPIAYLPLLFIAEIAGSDWIWAGVPTDVSFDRASFWNFEAGQLQSWAISLLAVGVVWTLIRRLFRQDHPPSVASQILVSFSVLTLSTAQEFSTCLLYWRSPKSHALRGMYFASEANAHLASQPVDWKFESFRMYLLDHLIPWALVFLLGLGFSYLWHNILQKQRSAVPVDGRRGHERTPQGRV